MSRWYNKNEKRRETIQRILAILNGLTHNEAELILKCALEELQFTSFVCQDEFINQKYAQNLNQRL